MTGQTLETNLERQKKLIPNLKRELTREGLKETLKALYEIQTSYDGKTPHMQVISFSSTAVYYNIDPRFTIGFPDYPARITKDEADLYLRIIADKGYLNRALIYLTVGLVQGVIGYRIKPEKIGEVEKLVGAK